MRTLYAMNREEKWLTSASVTKTAEGQRKHWRAVFIEVKRTDQRIRGHAVETKEEERERT